MRFLRMLTNSLLAGALGAAYLTVLVLQLNPHVPLFSSSPWRWFLTLGLFYGLHLAVIFYVVMVVREFFALDVLSPGWASVRVLAWLGAAAAAVASVLMWMNVQGLAATLSPSAERRMVVGAAATSVSALVLLGVAIAHYSFGRRGSRVGAALFVLAAFASLALPLAARGPGEAPLAPLTPLPEVARAPGAAGGPRVVMLLLDGGSLDYIWPRAAEGRLPNFGRILEGGASMYLATIRPTQPDPVWASVATGMYPASSGVRSAARYYARGDAYGVDLLPDHCFSHALVHLDFVREERATSAVWRARPLWSILSFAGIPVGVSRWPLTHPAPEVDGVLISDRFHRLIGSISEIYRAAHPPGMVAALEALASNPEGGAARAERDGIRAGAPAGAPEVSALERDRLYSRALRAALGDRAPRFTAVRYEGLDTVGHYYLEYTAPQRQRGVTEEERRQYSQAVERYYGFIDSEIGTALATLAPGDLLLVVSGFGMQRLNPLKRAVARVLGDPDFSGTHERAPDGFLLAYGDAVATGRHQRGSIVDIAPTILYFLGLPVARDMDGFARADLFDRDFSEQRPIAFIPSYSR